MYGIRPYGTLPYGAVPDPSDAQTIVSIPFRVSATARFTIYASTVPYVTALADTPSRQAFDGGVGNPISFSWRAQGNEGVVSGFGAGDGTLSLINVEGNYNILLDSYAMDGREHEVRVGRLDVPWSDWFVVFRGTARNYHVDQNELSLSLADYGYKLDQPLQPNIYAGTGGAEGGDDLKGKRKPRAFGYCSNVTAPLVDATRLIFQVSDGACEAIAGYVNGLPLTQGSDYGSYAALQAVYGTTSPGYIYTSKAAGVAMLHALDDSDVPTFDVQGENTGGFDTTVASIARRMSATWLSSAEIYNPGFTSYEAASGYVAGYYVDHESGISTREAIADFLGVGSFAYFTRMGKLSIARLSMPSGPPVARLDDTNILAVQREALPDGVSPPPWQWRVAYGRNWTTMQGNLAGAVSAARRAYLSESVRYAVAEDAAVKSAHPFSVSRTVGGYLRNEADAEVEAARLLALHRQPAALYRIRLGLRGYAIEQGQTVHIQSNILRWLRNGRHLFVVDRSINAADGTSEIVGFG